MCTVAGYGAVDPLCDGIMTFTGFAGMVNKAPQIQYTQK
jgi:hypothetical protein